MRIVGSPVLDTVRRQAAEEQSCTAADLQHTLGVKAADVGDGGVHPLGHLDTWDRLAGVAAVPAGDVEGQVGLWRRIGIGVFVEVLPLFDMFSGGGVIDLTGNEIGDELFVAGLVFAGEHDSILDGGVLAQHGFDLAEFDAEAAELDLVVDAAEEFDVAVGQPAHEVTGLVEAAWTEGIGDELLGSEFGAIQVAACQAGAAGIEFARDTDRDRLQGVVEDVDLRVGDGTADGNRRMELFGRGDRETAGEGRVFGGAIAIDELTAWQMLEDLAGMGDRNDIAAGQQLAQRAQIIQALIDHDMEEAGGEPERSDLMAANGLAQLFERRLMGRHDDELSAMQECTPDLERGGVKGDRRQLQPAFVRTEVSKVGVVHETNDVLVHHTDTFGLSRGAGGEHDIGEMRRVHLERGVITRLRGDAFPVFDPNRAGGPASVAGCRAGGPG